mgnify:CR=1 FL=1
MDVLTLSATPIPRTLNMALSGIRDMSTIEEPPRDRQPVQTYVMEYNDEMVREAIHSASGELAIERLIRGHTPSIRRDGIDKVLQGQTSLEEVLRVTRED